MSRKRFTKNRSWMSVRLYTPRMPDAVVLCGGAGLRLRSVTAANPKSMIDIGGRPFLELLLKQLKQGGVERVILAVGYKSDVIYAHFGEWAFGLRLAYSIEASPLGTGGAVRNSAGLVTSDPVLIMNGDSYTDGSLREYVTSHEASGAEVSVVVVPVDGREDCGTVDVDANGRVVGFLEKVGSANACYVNAGIYLLSPATLYDIPDGEVSLEREVFPRWIQEGRDVRAIMCPGTCIDIGTPDRYWRAQKLLRNSESKETARHEGHQ
jgi:mannose-1-phosphate guanylyltransferase